MGRAEFEQDHYAALELPSTATPNEIKKQFKKLALQYHPDRNPDQDTTAKFQAIQAANEILTDPEQRAKYDAQRIRSGLLHTYTDAPPPPPRGNATAAGAARSAASNFPPPPKPPPYAGKARYTTPKSGAQKYAGFSMPEPRAGTWRPRDPEDAKAKTSDFKAWEHMRHGQGPIPKAGNGTTKPATTSAQETRTSSAGRDTNGSVPRRPTSRRTDWEDLPDAGMPNAQRANSFRVPPAKPNGYAPTTPDAGDEPQARAAYFNIPRADRPTPPRAQGGMGPPPPPRAPTAKKPDPLQAFKTQMGNSDNVFNGKRHTPYPTVHGEKTDLKSPGLHRSATSASPRDSNSRTGFYDSEPIRGGSSHTRAASTGTGRKYPTYSRPGFESLSTTSSESSSDEDMNGNGERPFRSARTEYLRPTAKPTRPGMGSAARQRSFFNPYVRVEDAQDEQMAPHSDIGGTAYNGYRRHSHHDIPVPTSASYPQSEGFAEHRRRHEAEQSYQPSTSAPTGSATDSKRSPMSRTRSFDENYRSPPPEPVTNFTSDSRSNKVPIFRWGEGPLPSGFSAKPPLRSQSSDRIDLKFSPSGNPPLFQAGGQGSPSLAKGTSDDPIDITLQEDGNGSKDSTNTDPPDVGTGSKIPPPPQGPACFFPNDWHHRVRAASRSRSRNPSQKRTGTSRTSSISNGRRQAPTRGANPQPTVDETGDEPPVFSNATAESTTSSRLSSEGSAMDIDPVPTPPSASENQQTNSVNENTSSGPSPAQTGWHQGPTLPPRTAIPVPPAEEASNLNMGELRNAKPFVAGSEGLHDIGDLKTALPFDSRPSPMKPNFEKVTQVSQMPQPPKAPTPPIKLNETTWHLFVREMTRYMSNWANYNNVMLSHFHARQEVQGHMSPGWMVAHGDGDYNAYVESVVEDRKVHQFWEVACEKHLANMKMLGDVRQAMKAQTSKISTAV